MKHLASWLGTAFAFSLLVLPPGRGAAVENVDPLGYGEQFAWGENIGWVNAEPGGDGGRGMLVQDEWVTGYLWAENAGWISLSCTNQGVCGSADYGIANNGHGQLSGFAWGENIGWINFRPARGGGVVINPDTGEFGGDAWSENVGWIRFRGTGTADYGVTTSWRGILSVQIDIKPGSYPNSINLGNKGAVPVAIFSSSTFDAMTIDPWSVSLEGASVRVAGKSEAAMCRGEDVNLDGLIDLVCHVDTAQLAIGEGETVATLTGSTQLGRSIQGADTIRIVP